MVSIIATLGYKAVPSAKWTSLRPRAAIYAPGRSDVLPVYRFMTRDIATVAVQLVFISSVYMDITKSVRSAELIALLDFCRQEQKTLLLSIDCNSHSYLFSDCENNRGLEIDGLTTVL
jgi:energy-converting hydrogenase Eha subunit E